MAVKVKICGVTDPANALAAAELGAEYLGLNFYPGSPRYVAPERAVEIADAVRGRTRAQLVGVFVDAPTADVERIVVIVYFNEGIAQHRSLGQLHDCYVRVLNGDGNAELVRSENLAPALTTETALALGELYRHQGGWKFKVIGEGYTKGIAGIAADYGVQL